ncbi:MAG: ATP phosphoribosyltransferase [Paracoccaceae bacterium]
MNRALPGLDAVEPPAARTGEALAAVDAAVERLTTLFAGAGYRTVAPPHLFEAEVLLDLYGEDVRTRAFLFPGAGGEEVCLRPDFTVPVALAHAETGWRRAAKYAYRGPVFRRQPPGSGRPAEYLQAGIENFGALDPAAAEAQVLGLVLSGLDALDAGERRIVTGDLGIVFALLDALRVPERLRARLRRHVWRPARFHALLDAASERVPLDATGERVPLDATGDGIDPAGGAGRRTLLDAARQGPEAVARLAAGAGEVLGLREMEEIVERGAELAAVAAGPPMSREQVALVEAVLELEAEAGEALSRLRRLTAEAGVDLGLALDTFERRLDAFNRAGIDGETLPFDAGFGRTLEYYDGFVFEVTAEGRPELPPLAGGGRYDSLTLELGAPARVAAVGAMIRPEAALAAARPAPAEPATPAAPAIRRRAMPRGDLVLALPSKGRLQADTIDWFAARGIAIRRTGAEREYAAAAEGVPGLAVALLSAGEIPAALDAGRVHLGVTGQDLVAEHVHRPGRVRRAAGMGFGHADLVVAVPAWWVDVETMADLDEAAERFRARHGRPMRIATKYHNLARRFFRERGMADYRLVDSQGATEAAPANHAAEALVDITSSGETLRANHLKTLVGEPILRSQASLFVSDAARWDMPALRAGEALSERLYLSIDSKALEQERPILKQ